MLSNINNIKNITLKKLAISCNFMANSNILFQLKAEIASYKKNRLNRKKNSEQ